MSYRYISMMVGLVCGCAATTGLPPQVTTHAGPARAEPTRSVVALAATCGSLTAFDSDASVDADRHGSEGVQLAIADGACPTAQVDGVDAQVRTLLELHGYRVINSETLNASRFSRREVDTAVRTETESQTNRSTELRGTRFVDAEPSAQDAILRELDADALMTTRIWVGASPGGSVRRDVIVSISLFNVKTGQLAWSSRCRVEANVTLNEAPIMDAARCAADAAAAL